MKETITLIAFEGRSTQRNVTITKELHAYLTETDEVSYFGELGGVSIFKFPAFDNNSRVGRRKCDYGSVNLLAVYLSSKFGEYLPDYKASWLVHALGWQPKIKRRTNTNPNKDNSINLDKRTVIAKPAGTKKL